MKRIGIYGGTFSPPHAGHVQGVEYALSALELQELLVIPAFQSPGKQGHDDPASAEQRLEMAKLAFENIPGVCILDMELRRGDVSYTADTVAELRKQYPDAELVLLLGGDMFLSFPNWKKVAQLKKDASIGVFCREKSNRTEEIAVLADSLKAEGVNVYLLDNPVKEISSTDLRRMLAFGCADEFLSSGVADYIKKNKLYRTADNFSQLPMDELEKTVVSLLKPNRVAHVLGCRDTAIELAKHWGANETDAARAALLHDVTKALDGPLQLTLCRAYGIVLDDFSIRYPKTLHALTGSLVADRIFGENKAVVDAIASHTTGKANMNMLERIIYVADYMEPNRKFPGVEELRRLAYTDIDAALKLGLEMTLALLREQGSEISPGSRDALDWLANK